MNEDFRVALAPRKSEQVVVSVGPAARGVAKRSHSHILCLLRVSAVFAMLLCRYSLHLFSLLHFP